MSPRMWTADHDEAERLHGSMREECLTRIIVGLGVEPGMERVLRGTWESGWDSAVAVAQVESELHYTRDEYMRRLERESRVYRDSRGDPCSLAELVRKEPDWAASRIRELEHRLDTELRRPVAVIQVGEDKLVTAYQGRKQP